MSIFRTLSNRLLLSYVLVIVISAILAVVVWSYYAQKVKLLEIKEENSLIEIKGNTENR